MVHQLLLACHSLNELLTSMEVPLYPYNLNFPHHLHCAVHYPFTWVTTAAAKRAFLLLLLHLYYFLLVSHNAPLSLIIIQWTLILLGNIQSLIFPRTPCAIWQYGPWLLSELISSLLVFLGIPQNCPKWSHLRTLYLVFLPSGSTFHPIASGLFSHCFQGSGQMSRYQGGLL